MAESTTSLCPPFAKLFGYVTKAKEKTVCRFRRFTAILLGCVFCAASGISSPAQSVTAVVSFNNTEGAYPTGLIQGTDGNFYGTTSIGGANTACDAGLAGCGTVFKLTPSGTLTTLYSFCALPNCTDGWFPQAALVQGTDGNFYGTTASGGNFGRNSEYNGGTVFKITSAGVLTTLYNFCSSGAFCNDGWYPAAALIQSTDGNFYGTTEFGGFSLYCYWPNGCGSVFVVTPTGTETTIYSFCVQNNCPDGFNPPGGLVQASDGNFYGTTFGGTTGYGTLFGITAGGALTTLHTFDTTDDAKYPRGTLVQASNGNFYGVTSEGGANDQGTVFEMTLGGVNGNALTTLYSFCSQTNCADGSEPVAGLVQASNGNLYGTTLAGGTAGGTVFEITTGGALTILYNFCIQTNCTDGGAPLSSLIQASNGNLYGATQQGGSSSTCPYQFGCGIVFSIPGPVIIPASSTGCNGVYNGTFSGNLIISSGEICEFRAGGVTGSITMTGGSLILTNATVGGSVEIQGGTFTLGPSLTIQGDLQIQNLPTGTTANMICGATVAGDLLFQNNTASVQIGYQTACAGNYIGGYLQVGNNNASTWLFNNTVTGSLQDQNNSAPTQVVGNRVGGNLHVQNNSAATQVFNNSVASTLACQNNRSITGGGNTAKQKQGQCAKF